MKTKETKIINDCWNKLLWCFDPVSYNKHVDRLLEISLEESKQHDRFRGADRNQRDISISVEAKYFSILRLYSYFSNIGYTPKLEDYLHTQKSCYFAYALAKSPETSDYVKKWITENQVSARLISTWNYCDLINTEKSVSYNIETGQVQC